MKIDATLQPGVADGPTHGPGLSIAHISPHSCKSVRIVVNEGAVVVRPSELLAPPISLSRLDGGTVYLGGGEAGVNYYPDVQVAIEGRSAQVEFYPGASFIKAKRESLYRVTSAAPPPTNGRGSVSGFSHQSRTRLKQMLAKIQRVHLPLFVTLTYPGTFPVAPVVWKEDIDKFGKRFRRRFPNGGYMWKLEPQKRGAPHFHLLAWGGTEATQAQFYAELRAWIKVAWYETVASGDERHFRAGTRVEIIRSWSGVMHYASKYMAKPVTFELWEPPAEAEAEAEAELDREQLEAKFRAQKYREDKRKAEAWGNPGRWWGAVGRAHIPFAEKMTAWLRTGDVNALLRWIRRFRHLPGRDCMSRWAMVESPETWVDNIDRRRAITDSVDPLAAKNCA